MTSSESIEPWMFKSVFADSWMSEACARDNEILTRAIQKSLTNDSPADPISPFFGLDKPETVLSVQTPSGGSGFDSETPTPKRRAAVSGPVSGKITKRKSRASKRTTTTFITADPGNFRQMVQQVTGVRFGNGQLAVPNAGPVLKPEPHRPLFWNRFQGCLPTLDTSAFLLDHQQNNNQPLVVPSSTPSVGGSAVEAQPAVVAHGGSGGVAFDFESFSNSNFPTLESWN